MPDRTPPTSAFNTWKEENPPRNDLTDEQRLQLSMDARANARELERLQQHNMRLRRDREADAERRAVQYRYERQQAALRQAEERSAVMRAHLDRELARMDAEHAAGMAEMRRRHAEEIAEGQARLARLEAEDREMRQRTAQALFRLAESMETDDTGLMVRVRRIDGAQDAIILMRVVPGARTSLPNSVDLQIPIIDDANQWVFNFMGQTFNDIVLTRPAILTVTNFTDDDEGVIGSDLLGMMPRLRARRQ